MPHLEVHKSVVHPTAEGVGCGLIPRHSKCQNLSLVRLYAVHQGSILPLPEAGLASAVPGDDGHVACDSHAPDDGPLFPHPPTRSHPWSRMPCLDILDPDGICAACGYVDPVKVQDEDPPLLAVQHPFVVYPLPRDVEQADKPLPSPHSHLAPPPCL